MVSHALDVKLLNSPEGGCDLEASLVNVSSNISTQGLSKTLICIECETGLKADLSKFRSSILNRLNKYSEVWIIVSSKDQKLRYSKLFYADELKRIRIFMLNTLDSFLLSSLKKKP